MIFLDSNVLIYASGIHGDVDPRTQIARDIVLAPERYAISVQVLHEFYDRVTRPAKTRQLTDAEAEAFAGLWCTFHVSPMTVELFDQAIAIRRRYKFRYYDSAVIAAALNLNCESLLSEDFQHHQVIEGMNIINPFRDV